MRKSEKRIEDLKELVYLLIERFDIVNKRIDIISETIDKMLKVYKNEG